MNMKVLILVGGLLIAVTGCTLHKVTDQQQVCDQAKRQAIFNNSNPSSLTSYNVTDKQQAAIKTAAGC